MKKYSVALSIALAVMLALAGGYQLGRSPVYRTTLNYNGKPVTVRIDPTNGGRIVEWGLGGVLTTLSGKNGEPLSSKTIYGGRNYPIRTHPAPLNEREKAMWKQAFSRVL